MATLINGICRCGYGDVAVWQRRRLSRTSLSPQPLDIGIGAAHGCFELSHEKKQLEAYPAERALSAFVIRFLARLQTLGTVPGDRLRQIGRAHV